MGTTGRRAARAGAVALAAVSAVGVAACGSTTTSSTTAATQAAKAAAPESEATLVAASKKEGKLLIYSNALLSASKQVTSAFEKKYPWIKVTPNDLEDPVVFSKYAAEHATNAKTADVLIASAPGLWVGAVKNGFIQPYTVPTVANYPSWMSQGKGLYVFSADPAITIYNKIKLKGQAPPATIDQIAQDGIDGKYKIATYAISNNFGYTAFWGYVHQKGWAALEKLGKTAKTPGDGDVLYQDVAQGGFSVAPFESGLARGPIESDPKQGKLMGWEYTKDFTPLIPRGIGITNGAADSNSAKLFLNFVFSDEGQKVMCDAGFEAASKTFKPTNGCPNTITAVNAAVGGEKNTFLTPFSQQVADEQKSFTARFRKAFGQ